MSERSFSLANRSLIRTDSSAASDFKLVREARDFPLDPPDERFANPPLDPLGMAAMSVKRVNVRPDFVAGDSSETFDLYHSFSRNPFPPRYGRFVKPQSGRQNAWACAMRRKKISKRCRAHKLDRCATIHSGQYRALGFRLMTMAQLANSLLSMASRKLDSIHTGKQPKRPHHIQDWMDRRQITAAELAREIGVDKSLVSRWLAGSSPGEESQHKLAAFFGCDQEAIFRHPDDDWLSRFFRNRSAAEIERIKATLEAAFPRKDGTNG